MEACRRSAGGLTKLMAKPFEVVFEAAEAVEGGYDARALGYSIFTQGDDWEHLKAMVKDAVQCHFGDDCAVRTIRLRLVKDEAIAV